MKRIVRAVLRKLGYRPMGKMTLTAVIIHADGTTEDLGVLAKGRVEMTPSANDTQG